MTNSLNYGLLIMRMGVGIAMAIHGYPKMFDTSKWEMIGGAMGIFGISIFPVAWGFMAALTEFLGGILFALGAGTRVVSGFLFFTMFVAMSVHIAKGDGFSGYSHALELGVVFLGFAFTGPGRFSIDSKFCSKCS